MKARLQPRGERIETLMYSHKLRSPLARTRMSLQLMNLDASSPQRRELSRSITEFDQLISTKSCWPAAWQGLVL